LAAFDLTPEVAGLSDAFWYVTIGLLMVLVKATLDWPASGEVDFN
jgi:hypothetical protein